MATDRRTKYTKSVIREALFSLLKEKPLNKVTVTDICKLADINRSTFYSYYEDVNALLTSVQNDVFQDAVFSLAQDNWFEQLLKLVDENRDLCSILIGPHGDASFIRQLMYLGYDSSIRAWSKQYPNATSAEMDYLYAFISNGVIGIMENWVCDNYKESIEDVGKYLYDISMNGISFLKHDKPSIDVALNN